MERVDETQINYDLIEDLLIYLFVRPIGEDLSQLAPPAGSNIDEGAILIFLPGAGEIRTLSDRLLGDKVFGDQKKFSIVQLHGLLSSADQHRAFARPPKNCRKIVLATNIAETSVTIPDVVCGKSSAVNLHAEGIIPDSACSGGLWPCTRSPV